MKAKQKTSLKDMKQARTHMIFLSSSHTNRLTNPIKMFSKTIENQILAANNKHYMYHHETTQIHECIQQDPTKPSVLNGVMELCFSYYEIGDKDHKFFNINTYRGYVG